MAIDQPKVSALLNGRLANFSSDRLMRLLTALGLDVEIVVKAKPRNRERVRIHVIGDAHAQAVQPSSPTRGMAAASGRSRSAARTAMPSAPR
jgi:hypothetical protein